MKAEDFQKKTGVIPNPVTKKMKASSMVRFTGFVSYFTQEFSVIFSSKITKTPKIVTCQNGFETHKIDLNYVSITAYINRMVPKGRYANILVLRNENFQ